MWPRLASVLPRRHRLLTPSHVNRQLCSSLALASLASPNNSTKACGEQTHERAMARAHTSRLQGGLYAATPLVLSPPPGLPHAGQAPLLLPGLVHTAPEPRGHPAALRQPRRRAARQG